MKIGILSCNNIVLQNVEISVDELFEMYKTFSNKSLDVNNQEHEKEQESLEQDKEDEEKTSLIHDKHVITDMKKSAIISQYGKYRYQLSRIWDEERPKVLFIMLNPSTADDDVDDPTIRRVINFAKSWNFGGVFVGNLYAFRSTDPKRLKNEDNPTGDDNLQHITKLIGSVEKVIYAWGNNEREPDWLVNLVDTPYCIDVSKNGIPKHPLYLKGDSKYKLYSRDS